MAIRPWILRTLAGVALGASLAGRALAQAPATKAVAVVNGESITQADLDAILKARPLESLKLTDADYRDMRKEAVNLLIDDLLVHQFLRQHASPVPLAQANKKFRELQDALKAQGQTLDDYYRDSGQTEGQVRHSILATLQWTAYRDSHLNEAALRKYYEDNRDVLEQVTVRVSHILVRLRPDLTAGQRDEVLKWLQGLRQEIVSGKLTFAEAARKYSQDVSAAKGGDLGEIPRKGAVAEAFARAAFALKPKDVSEVVQTESGLHLITVTERKVGSPSTFEALQDRVRELAGEELLGGILAQQRQTAQVKVLLPEEPAGGTTQAGERFHFTPR
jgi:peptidyl-prolyl cis-trans isomerase C